MLWNRKAKEEKEKNVVTPESEAGEVMPEKVVQVDIDKEYPFVVQVCDIEDSTIIRRKPFGARRFVDGANVYLLNEKLGFKEPFPRDTDEFKQYTVSQLENKINNAEKKIARLRKAKDGATKRITSEELDLMQEIKQYKGFIRSLELLGKGSYMIIGGDYGGRPIYQFNRVGTFKIPVFTNIDYSLRYMPLESDLATAGELLKLNEDKNGISDNTFKLTMIGLAAILGICIIAVIYFNYLAIQINPEMGEVFLRMAESQVKLSDMLGQIVIDLNNVTGTFVPSNPDIIPTPGVVNVNN